MIWALSHRFDRRALKLADRHYSRQKPGTPQFVKPGHCIVLLTDCGRALWVSSLTEYPKHQWPGAWECPMFRNEGAGLSSLLIRAAVAVTRWFWGDPPQLGMVTFVDPEKTKTRRSKRAAPGHCFIIAGFRHVGETASGLLALQLLPQDMPPAEAPYSRQFGMAV